MIRRVLWLTAIACLVLSPAVRAQGEGESSTASITGVTAIDITPTSAAITWTVSEPATGQVEYGTTTGYGHLSVLEESFDYSTHVQKLAGLDPDTIYHFRVHSTTRGGEMITSPSYVFSTPPLMSPEPFVPHAVPPEYGPRAAPPTPEGATVVPAEIDATGWSDVAAELQAWVDAQPNASVLVFPRGSTYRMERGIHLDGGDRDLTFHGYGATLDMTDCGQSQHQSAFFVEDSRRIRILGFTIRGTNAAAGTTGAYTAGCGEYSMGIALYGDVRGIEIADVTISRVHGDALYVDCEEAAPRAGAFDFHHNLLELTGRQLVTINQGTGIRVHANVLRAPALYAVDSEDCRTSDAVLRDVQVTGNWIDTWNWHYSPDGEGPGQDYYDCLAIANTYSEEQVGEVSGYLVSDNYLTGGCGGWGSAQAGLCNDSNVVISLDGSVRKSRVHVADNVIDIPPEQRCGLAVELAHVTRGAITGNDAPGQGFRCRDCTGVRIEPSDSVGYNRTDVRDPTGGPARVG